MHYLIITTLIIFLNVLSVNAQQLSEMKNREELSLKNKQELIETALEILKEKQPLIVIDLTEYEASAWKNSKEIIVKFRRYIKFIPLNAAPFQYYDLTVNLNTKQILPFESGYNYSFYIPSPEDQKKLDFIKEKVDLSNTSNFDIIITENENHYWISKKSKTSFSKFFIEKETGLKSGLLEGSYTVSPSRPVLESVYKREEMIKLSMANEIDRITIDAVIQIAKGILQKKQPSLMIDFDDYNISVFGDSKTTLVEFRRIIRYVALGADPNKRISYDIKVNLGTGEISPFDDSFEAEFYVETKEDRKAIAFLKKNFDIFSGEFENTVYEGEEDYYIDRKNRYSFGKYKVDKKTGIGKAEIQASYEQMPKPDLLHDLDIFTEIK
jgi:hypothetical protein